MSKETNLTSLKVYGNDDPAGSVYKVSGGGAGNLTLYTAEEEIDGETVKYLTHKDGSIATWREIHDALIEGLPVSCVMIRGTSPLQPKLRDFSGQVPPDTGYHVMRCSVAGADYVTDVEPGFFSVSVYIGASSGLQFGAFTADDRLESAGR